MQTLTLVDPANPDGRRKIAELPGGGWGVGGASWDDRRLVLSRYQSATQSEIWLLDLASGERTRVLPAPGSNDKAVHLAEGWKRDNSGFFFLSDRNGEFRELMFYSLADARITSITRRIKGDIEARQPQPRRPAARGAGQGRRPRQPGVLRHRRVQRAAVAGAARGQRRTARFHPRLPVLAFALNGDKSSQIGTLVPADGGSQAWTRPYAPPGVDTSTFPDPKIVRYPSFDGREIPAFVYRPAAAQVPRPRARC